MVFDNASSDRVEGFANDAGGDNPTAVRPGAEAQVIAVTESLPTEVPLSSYTNRYEVPGSVSVRDRGMDVEVVTPEDLAKEGYKVAPRPGRWETPFDIRNPDVAPDTSATNIWGS